MSVFKRLLNYIKQYKEIPKGSYCYETLKIDKSPLVIKTRLCPYLNFINNHYPAYCRLMKDDVIDQCKICGIKREFNYV